MPRLANGPSFRLESLVGKHVAEIVSATDSTSDDVIEMLFLRVTEDSDWHRLFLDAGIGFWEAWCQADAFADYEDLRMIDLTDRWKLAGEKILAADCLGGNWDGSTLSRFLIELGTGSLHLNFSDSTDMDSDSVISFDSTTRIGT